MVVGDSFVPVNESPLAVISVENQTVQAGTEVTLDGSASSDDVGVVSYQWSEGGSVLGTQTVLSLGALSAGEYTIDLQVTDGEGATDTESVVITVEPAPVTGTEEGSSVAVNDLFTLGNSGSNVWSSVGFVESFVAPPVVISSVLTSNDADPAEVMLSDVSSVGVDVLLGEFEYQDGVHGAETLGLFYLEAGAHDFGGLSAFAGTSAVGGDLSRVDFGVEFSSAPVVLAHLMSEKEDVTAVVRVRDVDATGFSVQLQTEEALGTAGDIRELHYVAIEEGAGSHNGQRVIVGKTDRVVNHNAREIEFGEELGSPLFYAQDQQRFGNNTAWVRMVALDSGSAQVRMQEEQSQDSETTHTTTIVGWMAVGDPVNLEPPPLTNESPLAENDTASVVAGEVVTIDVLANDLDEGLTIDASVVTVAIVTASESGEAQVQSDGSVLYTAPLVTEDTTDTFIYSVTDADGASAEATVTVAISRVNTAPVAVDDAAIVVAGAGTLIDVLSNDSDTDGSLNVGSVSTSIDEAVAQADGTVLYTPAAGAVTDSPIQFTYNVADNEGALSNQATVTVTVTPANTAPIAEDDSATVVAGTEVSINVLANDLDEGVLIDGSTVTVAIVTASELIAGIAQVQSDGSILYTAPSVTEETIDTFSYSVTDAGGESDEAIVTVTINPANSAPVADGDEAAVVAGAEVLIDVLSNDFDEGIAIDASTVTVSIVDGPDVGAAVVQSNSTILYTVPVDTEEVSASFSYSVEDAEGAVSGTATVTVTITPSNAAPVAVDDEVTVVAGVDTPINVLANDLDESIEIDAEAVTLAIVDGSGPTVGTAVVQEDGTVFYIAPLDAEETTDTFRYSVTDAGGASAEATVVVTVTPANSAPVTEDDSATVLAGADVLINVLENDLDESIEIDAEIVTISIVDGSGPAVGIAVVQDDGTILYTVPADAIETSDSFRYSVTDAQGESGEALVSITIDPANTAPFAEDDEVTVVAGVSTLIEVLTNDLDEGVVVDASAVTVAIVDGSGPVVGTVVVQDDGTILYTVPADTIDTSDSFSYSVTDADGESGEASVTVTISPANIANTAPLAVDDEVTVVAGEDTLIDVLSNDSDDGIPSDVLTVIAGPVEPSHGTISIDPVSGVITYSSNPMMVSLDAVDQFSYIVEDESGLASNAATVTVTFDLGAVIHTHHEMIPNPVYGTNVRVAEACKGVAQGCDWSSASTWVTGAVPDGDSRVIVDGHVRIQDLNALARSIGIYPEGKLAFAANDNTRLSVADLLVFQGGTLEIGTQNSPISSSVRAEVVFRDLPFDETDPKQHLRGLLTIDGEVNVYGHELDEVFIRATGEPASGDTVIALNQSATSSGWRVGDTVVIPSSHQCPVESGNGCTDQTEERTVSSISGSSITLDAPLDFDHPGARDHNGVLDFTPHVVNKTRNVVFRSENPQGVRGHLLLHGRSDIDIRYAEFQSLGRTDIRILSALNQKGRYPVHAHHLIGPRVPQSNGYQFTLVGNTVDFGDENNQQDRKWGISIHESHYGLIDRNIIDRASGAGMVTESGSEAGNRFSNNFVVRIVGGNGERLHDPDPTDGSKLGRAGSAYWFNGGGRNHFENNVAAAVVECVYCYGFKFDNVDNSTLQFPRNQGDDPHMGGGVSVDPYTVGINDFINNEAYAVPNGLTIWWECSRGDTPRSNCSSHIELFSVWHHHRWGYYGYPVNNMTIQDFVMRGDPTVLNNRFEGVIGMNFSDYMTRNTSIVNADIQNVRTAIQMPSMRGARNETGLNAGFVTVEDSYMVSTIGLDVVLPSSVNGAGNLPPQTAVVSNVQFESIDPGNDFDEAFIFMNDQSQFPTNTGLRNDIQVFNYNSAPGIEGEDLYIVPAYQGPASCDSRIGQCDTEITSAYPDISQGHVYRLGALSGVELEFPTANAGVDQTVERGDDVLLDATQSTDADGTIVSYQWTRNGTVLATGAQPAVSSVALGVGVHTIDLLVTDNDSATATDSVVVTVTEAVLIANDDAGIVEVESSVAISVFDNDIGVTPDVDLETNTDQPAQNGFFSVDKEAGIITYFPHIGRGPGTDSFGYRFRRPGVALSNVATVHITIVAANIAPIANAGADQTIESGEVVTLNGSFSSDADGSIESYLWTRNGVEVGTGAIVVLSNLAVGTYTIDLLVTDDDGSTATDSVVITVNEVANVAPIADAGADQIVDEGTDVTLNGGNSEDTDGNIVSYLWTESGAGVGTGESVLLSDLSVGTHTITLLVTDDDEATATDSVVITVNAVENQAPIADAGADQTVDEGTEVTLDGSGSEDTDGGSIVSYLWTEEGAEVGTGENIVLSDLSVGTHTITLLVTDDEEATATDSVEITVNAVENLAPIADAGADQTVDEGNEVTLDASGSEDSDGSVLSYLWTDNGVEVGTGEIVVLSNLAVGTHTIDLLVTDEEEATATDSVEITVNAVENLAPIADAGADQTVDEGTEVTLDGSGSEDTDGGSVVSYLWTENGVEVGTGVSPVLSGLVAGSYDIELLITDNLGATATDSVTVTVNDMSGCSPAGSADRTISLLMVGNRLMNDIESKLEQLLDCGGYTSDIDTYNPAGYTLTDHDADEQTTASIAEGYDLTLLQELSTDFLNRAPPYETISALDSKIAAALSGMGFYQTWGLQDRNIEETESFLSAYESAAEFFEAPIIHIGRAWDYFYTLHSEEPPFSLYLDEANPTEEGKALIAYVVYAYVTGESPLLTTTLGLDGDDALLLQNTAWDSYQLYGLQFHP